jgi:ribose-phosphate pyrophosphokinase
MRSEMVILATRTMRDYADKVARHAAHILDEGKSPEGLVGELAVSRFADGEMEVDVQSSIRGKDVYLFANCARNGMGLSVEECKIELYHTIDAITRAQAGRIAVFEPYVSSSRSDRANRRNSVGLWIHFKTMISLGADHIINYQLHSDKSKSMIDPALACFDDVPGTYLLKKFICDLYIKSRDYLNETVKSDWLFCSVDSGGEKLAKRFASSFGTRLVIAHKQRDYSTVNTVESVNILSSVPIAGKCIWIVDDLIDTGASIYTLVKELKRFDVREVNIAAVHPVFSDPAVSRLRALHDEGLLKRLIITDTVPCPECVRESLPFVQVVTSSQMSAEIICTIHEERSLSKFFAPFNAEGYLESERLFI